MKRLLLLLLLLRATGFLYAQDLSITGLQYAKEQTQYQQFNARITLRNAGTVAVNAFVLTELYLSKDKVPDKGDGYFCFVSLRTLSAGGTSELDVSGVANQFGINAAPGGYYLLAKADVRDEVAETDEANNLDIDTLNVLPARVDLAFASPRVLAGTVALGATLTPVYTLNNLQKDNVSSVWTTFYLSADERIDATDQKWDYRYNGLGWVSGKTFSQSLTVPYTLAPGVYNLYGKIENTGQELNITETNAANNTAFFGKITVVGQSVDLRLNSLRIAAFDHERAKVDYTIANGGSTGIQGYGLRIYFSRDRVLDAADQVGILYRFHDHPSYAVGANATVPKTELFTARTVEEFLPAGTWYAIAEVNYDRKVPETDYLNNRVVSEPFTVPDYTLSLLVQNLALAAPVGVGATSLPVKATLVMENYRGATGVDASLYLGKDSLLQRWTDYVSLSGASYAYQKTLPLATALRPGTYRLVLTTRPEGTRTAPASQSLTFTVHPLALQVRADTSAPTSVLLHWVPQTRVAGAAYRVKVTDPRATTVLDTVSLKDSLRLPVTRFAPDTDHSVAVEYVKDNAVLGSGKTAFRTNDYRSLVTLQKVEGVVSAGMLLADSLPVRVTLSVKQTNTVYPIRFEVLDSLDRVLATRTDSVLVRAVPGGRIALDTLDGPAGGNVVLRRQLPLDQVTAPGVYRVKVSSPFTQTVLASFTVPPNAIVEQAAEYLPDAIRLQWRLQYDVPGVQYTVRVSGTGLDTLIAAGTHNSLQLPAGLFRSAGPHSWSVTGTLNGKTVQSGSLPLPSAFVLGLGEPPANGLVVYPNPSRGRIYLRSPGAHFTHVQVCRATGQQVAAFALDGAHHRTGLLAEGLQPGVYVVVLASQSAKQYVKVVVQ